MKAKNSGGKKMKSWGSALAKSNAIFLPFYFFAILLVAAEGRAGSFASFVVTPFLFSSLYLNFPNLTKPPTNFHKHERESIETDPERRKLCDHGCVFRGL